MKSMDMKFLYASLFALLLTGCGSGTSDSVTPPQTSIPDVVFEPIVVSGIAAAGAALDGATVEVIDASGNLVDVGDALTGSDGSYQVQLPQGVELPVIVRVTPPGGTPLLNIVPPAADGETEVVANINPVTDLVSNQVLGDADAADNAALAGALANVDSTTIEASGNEVVGRLLGASVKYSSFSNDPDFVAKTSDASTTSSAADAILDTLARKASKSGSTIKDQLKSLNEQEDPPQLLAQPDFQIGLVSEMVKGGSASTDLESKLSAIGAIPDPVEGEADVFRAVIETVPAVMETVRSGSSALVDDPDLLDVAVDAAIDLLANTVQAKKDRFATADAGLVNAIKSPSLQQTVARVVETSVVPTLSSFVGSGSTETVKASLIQVVDQVTTQASVVTSSFTYTETSTDVSNLVSGFVAQQVTAPTTIEELEAAASGTTQTIQDLGDVNTVKTSLETFADDNIDLVEGSLDDLIEPVPPGTWNNSNWGNFNWG
ncbi:MAG: hypothetical protein WD002_10410 [Pseudomonadales bacterium]